jgi:ribosomal protein S18 acetylase RimI-like enzyme
LDAPQPGHYWKTPFYWESGCPLPPSECSLRFEPVSDEALRSIIGAVMVTSMDDADKFTVPRIGIDAAVQEVYDLLPQYFDRQADWWRICKDAQGAPVGFVLPVAFKEQRFWKDGRPQGTVLYMGVLPQFRGLGYGLELVHEATRVLLAAGSGRIFCDTGTDNTPMIKAFRQAGYTERKPWQRPLA